MFTKGVLSLANRVSTRNAARFFSTFSTNNYVNRLKELFPKHVITSRQEGHVLFGCNSMKLTETTLALRRPEQMAQFIRKNELSISEIRQFTLKKNLDEVIQVEDKVFVPFEYARPHREVNEKYLDLFKLDNVKDPVYRN
jgi:hypothetical protein